MSLTATTTGLISQLAVEAPLHDVQFHQNFVQASSAIIEFCIKCFVPLRKLQILRAPHWPTRIVVQLAVRLAVQPAVQLAVETVALRPPSNLQSIEDCFSKR